jgi:alpha-tubulin suppressor-like RCC1 family protein
MGAGDLQCWGSNTGDQLLNETVITEFSLVPVLAEIPDDVFLDDVEGGIEHACILTTKHEVMCWGPNTLGQAGVGMAGYVFEPTSIDLTCP